MMLSPQVLGSRPGQPVSYANITKDEVLHWFRNAPGATRIDTLCGLLDSCIPFEIRFVGSMLETFARKEFHQLRDMTDRANKVYNKRAGNLEENVTNFYLSIIGAAGTAKEEDVRRVSAAVAPRSSNSQASSIALTAHRPNTTASSILPAVSSNSQSHLILHATTNSTSSHQHQPQSLSSVVTQETSLSSRPVPASKTEPLRTSVFEPPQLRQQISRNHSPVVTSSGTVSAPPQSMVNGISAGAGRRSNCSSEDETEPTPRNVLDAASSRQKLILYLSLLSSTNHEAALVYYALISQVNRTVGDNEWMEKQNEATLEEVTLLYTLGIHHPAFSYEQRLMLSEILVKVRRELQRKKAQAFAHQVFPPVQYGFGPLHFPMPPMTQSHLHSSLPMEHLGNPPLHAPGSAGGPQGIPNTMARTVPLVDTSRMPPLSAPQINYYQHQQIPYPPYPSTHPQNPSFANPSVATSVGQLNSAIRSTSPSNIPTPTIPTEAVPTSATKAEKLPPPFYEKIPVLPVDPTLNFQIPRPERVSCYNCGQQGHTGIDCESASIEAMSHHLFRLNFEDNNNKNKPN